jgi:hypothetical protein
MKKVLCVLLALIAVPAMAANVVITGVEGTAGANKTLTIGYNSGTGTLPCAFGLDLQLSDPTALVSATVASGNKFWVYPGSIQITNGVVTALGTPFAVPEAPGVITNGKTIEMGALYTRSNPSDPNKPLAAGDLVVLTFSKTCTVTVGLNSTRGGVVLEDTTAATISGGPFTITISTVCKGDANADGKISSGDISALVAFLSPAYKNTSPPYTCTPIPAGKAGLDANGDGKISSGDISALVAFLSPAYKNTSPPYTFVGCMP